MEFSVFHYQSVWQYNTPDSILLHIFRFLNAPNLMAAGRICKFWRRISLDELLWQKMFTDRWGLIDNAPIAPDKKSWRSEYKRLVYHVPVVQTEVLKDGGKEFSAVAITNKGDYFVTVSGTATVKLWKLGYPSSSIKMIDLEDCLRWKDAGFPRFNHAGDRLLISGFVDDPRTPTKRDGRAAVLSVPDLSVYATIPNDVFCNASWFMNKTILTRHFVEDDQGTTELRMFLVPKRPLKVGSNNKIKEESIPYNVLMSVNGKFYLGRPLFTVCEELDDEDEFVPMDEGTGPIYIVHSTIGLESKVYISYYADLIQVTLAERLFDLDPATHPHHMQHNYSVDMGQGKQITSACLSPDRKMLYFSYRRHKNKKGYPDPDDKNANVYPQYFNTEQFYLWECNFSEALRIGAVNLETKQSWFDMHFYGHKNNGDWQPDYVGMDCSENYIISGSCDASAYLWETHYTFLIAKLCHKDDTVRSVAFCPNNQECMITVGEDGTIRIWRSRNEIRKLGTKKRKGSGSKFITYKRCKLK